jgi:hypothetical protein
MLSQDQDVINIKETILYTNVRIENTRGFNVKSNAKLIRKLCLSQKSSHERPKTNTLRPHVSSLLSCLSLPRNYRLSL